MKLIECPRDAMQGISEFIPTDIKSKYLNALLKVGFNTIDFGSFVSPKAIPQMRDTADVLSKLSLNGNSKLLAIVANLRGANDAGKFDEIHYLGFPLSISETFQQRNTNKSIDEALGIVSDIQNVCIKKNKSQVVYLSMGFGNPYGDPYDPSLLAKFVAKLDNLGVNIISLADTIGSAHPRLIREVFSDLIPEYPHIEFGAHLHSTPDSAREKIEAVYDSGCRRMDGAILGIGGCPMAKDELTGNIDTLSILDYLSEKTDMKVNQKPLAEAKVIANEIFTKYF